jgi:hypothetical protein
VEVTDAAEVTLPLPPPLRVRVSEARSISSANDRISSREVCERDTEPGDT